MKKLIKKMFNSKFFFIRTDKKAIYMFNKKLSIFIHNYSIYFLPIFAICLRKFQNCSIFYIEIIFLNFTINLLNLTFYKNNDNNNTKRFNKCL